MMAVEANRHRMMGAHDAMTRCGTVACRAVASRAESSCAWVLPSRYCSSGSSLLRRPSKGAGERQQRPRPFEYDEPEVPVADGSVREQDGPHQVERVVGAALARQQTTLERNVGREDERRTHERDELIEELHPTKLP